jgi:hypothetical protein
MHNDLNRRDFPHLSGLVAAAALGTATADEPAKRKTPRKAILYATLSFPGSVLDKFQAIKATGSEGVEPMSHRNQEEVVKALETTGLKAASAGAV